MLEESDLLIEQKGYLFSSIFIFRRGGGGGRAAHIVRTLLRGCYIKSEQKRTRRGGGGSKLLNFERTYFLNGPISDKAVNYIFS